MDDPDDIEAIYAELVDDYYKHGALYVYDDLIVHGLTEAQADSILDKVRQRAENPPHLAIVNPAQIEDVFAELVRAYLEAGEIRVRVAFKDSGLSREEVDAIVATVRQAATEHETKTLLELVADTIEHGEDAVREKLKAEGGSADEIDELITMIRTVIDGKQVLGD